MAVTSCRICGECISGKEHPIFCSVGNDGFTTTTLNLMIKCFRLQFSADDGKPSSICDKCHIKLVSFADFQELCYTTDARFQKSTPIENTSPADPVIGGLKCPHCCRSFKRRATLYSHIGVAHTLVLPFACVNCPKRFALRSQLTTHRVLHSNRLQCRFCAKRFMAPSKLERHIRTHLNHRTFTCQHCTTRFTDKSNLSAHIKALHNNDTIMCDHCNKCFKTHKQLKQHTNIHLDEARPYYHCAECNRRYRFKCNLVTHMRKHLEYMCNKCHIKCGKWSNFQRHKTTCNGRPTDNIAS